MHLNNPLAPLSCQTLAARERAGVGLRGCRSRSVHRCRSHASALAVAGSVHRGQSARNPAQPVPRPDITVILRSCVRLVVGPPLAGRPHQAAALRERQGRATQGARTRSAPLPVIYFPAPEKALSAGPWNIRERARSLLFPYFAFCCPLGGQNVTNPDMYYAHCRIPDDDPKRALATPAVDAVSRSLLGSHALSSPVKSLHRCRHSICHRSV